MNVEAGPSGAVGLAGTAPVAAVEFSTIVNEGPVSLSALQNTEIVFRPNAPSVIEQAEAVAAKAWEAPELDAADAIAEAQVIISEAAIVPNVIPAWVPDHLTQSVVIPQVEPAVLPRLDYQPVPWVEVGSRSETKVSHQAAPVVSPQPLLQEQEVKEVVTEKVRDEKPKEILVDMEERVFLEDERASAVRRFEIKQAIKRAFAEAKNAKLYTIVGSLVAKFLPGEHEGNRSSALQGKGPDGSYEETVEAISLSGKLYSKRQAEERLEGIVTEKKPIKLGKDGTPVKNEDVARVFRPYDVKPVVEAKTETSLEDYPQLLEVFQKAA